MKLPLPASITEPPPQSGFKFQCIRDGDLPFRDPERAPPLTTYYFRVTSTNAANNTATSPGFTGNLNFTTPIAPLVDTTVADFTAGTSACYISNTANGELILPPAVGDEFNGTTLSTLRGRPKRGPWPGGTATVSGGALNVDGAHAYSDLSFGPGSSLSSVPHSPQPNSRMLASLAIAPSVHPGSYIGEGASTDGVYARMDDGRTSCCPRRRLALPMCIALIGHASGFAFYVDGTQVTANVRSVAGNMVVNISDVNHRWRSARRRLDAGEPLHRTLHLHLARPRRRAAADWHKLTYTVQPRPGRQSALQRAQASPRPPMPTGLTGCPSQAATFPVRTHDTSNIVPR